MNVWTRAVLVAGFLAGCASVEDRPAVPQGAELDQILEMLEHHAHLVDVPLEGVDKAWEIVTPGLRTWFAEDRVVLGPQRPERDWQLELRFDTWGRSDQRQSAPLLETRADGPRVELVREGLTEWYVDRTEGLEQGFTLEESPPGAGPIELSMRLEGDVGVVRDGDALLLSADGYQRLRYDTLVVVDAEGVELPAELGVEGCEEPDPDCHILIRFDDRGAAWPITVDPLLTQQETGPMSHGPGRTGYAVDADGDWAIVGVPAADGQGGKVVILERNQGGTNAWGVVFEHTSQNLGFGKAVAIDYPIAVVGAPDSERVHFFVHTGFDTAGGPTWAHSFFPQAWAGFGASVAVSGQLVAVGAPGAGRVRTFHRHLGGIFPFVDLTAPVPNTRFGEDVALDGVNLLVGAPGANAAYMYRRGPLAGTTETFTQVAAFQGPVGGFGGAVALDDGVAAVAGPQSGTIIYRQTGFDQWDLELRLRDILQTGDALGRDVALVRDRLYLSDRAPDGAAWIHVFDRDDQGKFIQSETLKVNDGGTPTLAASEDVLVVGVPDRSPNGGVQFFRAAGDGLRAVVAHSPPDGAKRGQVLAIDGDWLFIGAPSQIGGEVLVLHRDQGAWQYSETLASILGGFGSSVAAEGGRLFVGASETKGVGHFVRTPAGRYVTGTPVTIAGGTRSFGQALALKGDFLIVGEPGRRSVHVYERHANGSSDSWGLQKTLSEASLEDFGQAVAFDGSWLAVGGKGEVRLFEFAAHRGIRPYTRTQISGGAAVGFGSALALKDGVLAVGVPHFSGGGFPARGRVWVYTIHSGEWKQEKALVATNPVASAHLGSALDIWGEHIYAGAPGAGQVIRFGRNVGGSNNWGQERVFSAGPAHGGYGSAVVARGGMVLVGAPQADASGLVFEHHLDADLPPMTRSVTIHTQEDQSFSLDLKAHSYDPNGDPITIQIVSPPAHGTFANDRYTPDVNYHGTDSISFRARAGGKNSNLSYVTIQIAEVNDKCELVASPVFEVDEDNVLTVGAAEGLANFVIDVDGDPLTFRLGETAPSMGTLSLDEATGAFTYEPYEDRHGQDTFSFYCDDGRTPAEELIPITVQIQVHPVPDPPVVADLSFSMAEDETLSVPAPGLLQEATDVDGDLVHARLVAAPTHGFVTVRHNGGFVYQPEAGFWGTDSFHFQAVDETGLASEPATVTIQIAYVNDPPVANDDAYETMEDTPLNVTSSRSLLLNDYDEEHAASSDVPAPLARVLTPPSHGVLSGFSSAGVFRYQPEPNWFGTDSFTYELEDHQGARSTPATVTIHVWPVNDPPFANADEYEWNPEQGLAPSADTGVLANDGDHDGDPIWVASLVKDVTYGTLELEEDGSFTYEPQPGFEGVDSFSYTVTDGESTSLPALVRIQVPDNPSTDPTPGGGGAGPGCEVSTYFVDRDGDGFGDDASPVEACEPGEGLAEVGGDCDDSDASVYPGAKEIAHDGVDQDCNGRDATVEPVGACSTVGSTPALWWLLALFPYALGRRKEER